MKKRSERDAGPPYTHTVRDDCSKAEPKFSPGADPLPGDAGPPKFN